MAARDANRGAALFLKLEKCLKLVESEKTANKLPKG